MVKQRTGTNDKARNTASQRRSRDRKRSYLMDIEQKLREYQSQGAEASAEVQKAARHVANENRKLRQLLCKVGLDDEQIEKYIQTGILGRSGRNTHLENENSSGAASSGQATATLEGLLVSRRPPSLQAHKPFGRDSRVGDGRISGEEVHPSYGLVPAPAINLNPPSTYPQGDIMNQQYGDHQINPGSVEWTEGSHNQASYDFLSHAQGHVPNQTFGYRPQGLADAPSTSHPSPSRVYHSHQPPAFLAAPAPRHQATGLDNDDTRSRWGQGSAW